MRKILVLLMIVCLLPVLCSCDSLKLSYGFHRLSTESYTMQGTVKVKMMMEYNSFMYSDEATMDVLIQSNPNEFYSETKFDDVVQKTYAKINEENLNEVLIYNFNGYTWSKETKTKEEYLEESESYFLDIEADETFKYQDGIYVGDVELITNMLDKYIDKLTEDLVGTGSTFESFRVSKYYIEMDKLDISKLDIEMILRVKSSGYPVTVTMSMPLEVSNVGSTTINVPSGLETIK